MRSALFASVTVGMLVLSARPALGQDESPSLRGFTPRSSAWEREYESKLGQSLSPKRAEQHLRWLTSRPHLTGSEGTRITGEYLHRQMEEDGFETETLRYDAYLPAPVSVSIELIEPVKEVLPTTEDRVEGDPFTASVGEHPGWNGYSPSGEASGQVVYGHFGSEQDFRSLVEMGIDLKGKILLLRYFGTGEGRKVANAERFGAAGVVLYVDPAEDGFPFGEVYPKGNWRPPGAIMRRSIEFLPYSGDPLSPGWASIPGAKRLALEDVYMPGIPVLPVSYRSAERILTLLGGPEAPRDWQGALPVTYKVGPGSAKLHIRTEMDNRDRPMLNVIGRLEGEFHPDQWVLIGNHHDAWIYGAGDPSSGTASLLELARSLGELARQGFRPRRTLILCFWDAEEMLLGGSTEWVEDHAEELLEKAVAYINMDSSVFNPDRPLSVSSHPVLHRLFRAVARDIEDPRTGRSLFDVWRDLQNQYRKVPSVDGWGEFFNSDRELTQPYLFESPYDDAAPFFYFLAMPASDMYYGADYGMYHSIYENFHWMKTVVDPTFEYHILMAKLQGMMAIRLANAELVPLDYAEEARYWRKAYEDLEGVAKGRGQTVPKLSEARGLIDDWESEAETFWQEAKELLADDSRNGSKALDSISRSIYRTARDFYRAEGRPGAPLDRNLFTGGSHDFEGVSGSTLPGIRFAMDKEEMSTARKEAEIYLSALRRRNETLSSLRLQMRELQ